VVLVKDGRLTPELETVVCKWKAVLGDSLIVLENETNVGLTRSLNKGLKYVKGELIARMDSDDISHPRRFEIQHDYLVNNPDIDVLGGALQEFNDECECLNVRYYPENPEEVIRYICKASPLAHPAVMIRRRIFDEGLKYDESYRTSQDLALWYDVLCRGYKIANIPDVLICFRLSGDAIKRRSRHKAFNEFKIYMKGIYRLNGAFTLRYIYPISRLIFRLMPESIIRMVYGSGIRRHVLSE
jgi:glycosyltransferase involved in cell wall biosynthesis